jgi:hypothetical protein
MVIDAFVEVSNDNGATWRRMNDPREDFRWFDGPWAVPEAVEVAREYWTVFLRVTSDAVLAMGVCVRVIDVADVVVEQWPKRAANATTRNP